MCFNPQPRYFGQCAVVTAPASFFLTPDSSRPYGAVPLGKVYHIERHTARSLSENAEHIFGRFFGSFFLKKGT